MSKGSRQETLKGCNLKREDGGQGTGNEDGEIEENIFSPSAFHFFTAKGALSPDPFLFPHMTFQSLGYVMKRAAAFRVYLPTPPHPSALG